MYVLLPSKFTSPGSSIHKSMNLAWQQKSKNKAKVIAFLTQESIQEQITP